ncbi:MAG: hypothetical protein RLZZ528_1390 [Pseudomonadota bacterium]
MRAVFLASYGPTAMRGLIAGSNRPKAIEEMLATVCGKLVSVMFCRGEFDAVVTVELPDRNAVVAGTMAVLASGSLTRLSVLEELDMGAVLPLAAKAAAAYKPAG